MKNVSLIKTFPLILEDLPGYVEELQKQYRWKLEEKPVAILRRWKEVDTQELYYFLGWFTEAMAARGVPGNVRFLNLANKRALDKFLQAILDEASSLELECFERGKSDLSFFEP